MVHGRPFLFRIPTKDTVVAVYSTLSPQKYTKLNTEKQHAQGHLGLNLTPERGNRNFRKTAITSNTKSLCRPTGNLSWQSHEGWCHCKIHKKVIKNDSWGHIWPRVTVWGLSRLLILHTLNLSVAIWTFHSVATFANYDVQQSALCSVSVCMWCLSAVIFAGHAQRLDISFVTATKPKER
jgi:hypothetical protein